MSIWHDSTSFNCKHLIEILFMFKVANSAFDIMSTALEMLHIWIFISILHFLSLKCTWTAPSINTLWRLCQVTKLLRIGKEHYTLTVLKGIGKNSGKYQANIKHMKLTWVGFNWGTWIRFHSDNIISNIGRNKCYRSVRAVLDLQFWPQQILHCQEYNCLPPSLSISGTTLCIYPSIYTYYLP